MNERPTFSPVWHRVRATTPTLRPHVQVTRQIYRGKRWHVAHDPTSNQFYRLSPVAYDFVSSLDGVITVDKAWELSLTRHGDMAPTQNEVIELIGQLYNSNLIKLEATPETEQLLRRGRERTRKRVTQQAIGLMYFKLKLFNPDMILTAVEPVLRPMLNKVGLVVWILFLISGLWVVIPNWDRAVAGLDMLTSPSNWGWMIAAFVLLKLWHELGHGVICKRLGGQVPEFGAMLLVLIPSPYVDASSAWAFANKWQRISVGAGGMIFELFAAAIAAHIWANGTPGTLVSSMAYFIMVSSGVSTVLFNANPLMRFDGYYMLSDLLEVPNLSQRANQIWIRGLQRSYYRVENVRPVSNLPGERFILVVYGALAFFYRILIFLAISSWLLGFWFGLGLVLAVWSLAAWIIMPTGKAIHWLATSSQLTEHRPRALALTALLVGGIALLIGAVPLPDWRRAPAVVEAERTVGVFIAGEGFVEQAHVRPGDAIDAGQPIVTLASPELTSELAATRADQQEVLIRLRDSQAKEDATGALVYTRYLQAVDLKIADLQRRARETVVRAPFNGIIVRQDPARLIGAYVKEGSDVCTIIDPKTLHIHAVMEQGDAAWLFDAAKTTAPANSDSLNVELRFASDLSTVVPGKVVRIVPSGQRMLPHASLSFSGGGQIENDQTDQTGRLSKHEKFSVFLTTKDHKDMATLAAGQRVYVRFTLPGKPIASQLFDRLLKTLQGRVNL
jgi:putative peptide zinc metalloprotease protein